MRLIGRVKWFDDKKGFGFILNPEGDVFVHYSVIEEEGYRTLTEGQEVEYELCHTDKGLSARHVKRIEKTDAVDPQV